MPPRDTPALARFKQISPSNQKEINVRTWEDNAAEFAALDRGDGWQFAVLVACSVERGTGGPRTGANAPVKVSAREFAEAAGGTHRDRVIRYLNTWQQYAAEGTVPDASTLTPEDVSRVRSQVPDDLPWKAKDGGRYETSATNKAVASAGRVADRAARDPEYAEQVIREVTEAAPKAAAAALTESIAKNPEVASQAMRALDDRYDAAPKPIAPHDTTYGKPVELVHQFRQLHRSVDSIISLVIEGKAIVSDAERDAVLREVQWLRTALQYIEEGVQADNLDQALENLLRAES